MKKYAILFIILVLTSFLFAQFNLKSEPIQVSSNLKLLENEILVEITVKMAKDVHIYTSKEQFFEIVEKESVGLGAIRLDLPPVEMHQGDFDDAPVATYSGTKILKLYKPYSGISGTEWKFAGYFGYQGCDKNTCYPPKKFQFTFSGTIPEITHPIEPVKPVRPVEPNLEVIPTEQVSSDWQNLIQEFTISHAGAGYMDSKDFLNFLNNSGEQDIFQDKSIWLVLLLILLGGLALNLTPCVLPMIPINLAIIGAGAKAGSKSRGFMLGLVYGIGMALAYGTLGVVVVLTGSQFGSINASPWFNVSVAIIFVVLGLAMFDLFSIDFSRFSRVRVEEEKKGNFFTAFSMGILAAVLAGACVAPVLLSVLVYSHTLYLAGNQAGLLLPFLLGIGMALPWPLAGASLSLLPKPGKWMQQIKYFFGIFIFLMAIYYSYTAYTLWQGTPTPATNTFAEVKSHSEEDWITTLEKGLEESQKTGKPVFIDFWATWCKNCLAMSATTFQNEEVKKELSNYVKVKYQAEDMSVSPHQEVIEYFQTNLKWPTFGLPSYVILKPKLKPINK